MMAPGFTIKDLKGWEVANTLTEMAKFDSNSVKKFYKENFNIIIADENITNFGALNVKYFNFMEYLKNELGSDLKGNDPPESPQVKKATNNIKYSLLRRIFKLRRLEEIYEMERQMEENAFKAYEIEIEFAEKDFRESIITQEVYLQKLIQIAYEQLRMLQARESELRSYIKALDKEIEHSEKAIEAYKQLKVNSRQYYTAQLLNHINDIKIDGEPISKGMSQKQKEYFIKGALEIEEIDNQVVNSIKEKYAIKRMEIEEKYSDLSTTQQKKGTGSVTFLNIFPKTGRDSAKKAELEKLNSEETTELAQQFQKKRDLYTNLGRQTGNAFFNSPENTEKNLPKFYENNYAKSFIKSHVENCDYADKMVAFSEKQVNSMKESRKSAQEELRDLLKQKEQQGKKLENLTGRSNDATADRSYNDILPKISDEKFDNENHGVVINFEDTDEKNRLEDIADTLKDCDIDSLDLDSLDLSDLTLDNVSFGEEDLTIIPNTSLSRSESEVRSTLGK